eukprot:COSAG03_NODE_102_length_12788_cov_8.752384_10_plen_162_part_00
MSHHFNDSTSSAQGASSDDVRDGVLPLDATAEPRLPEDYGGDMAADNIVAVINSNHRAPTAAEGTSCGNSGYAARKAKRKATAQKKRNRNDTQARNSKKAKSSTSVKWENMRPSLSEFDLRSTTFIRVLYLVILGRPIHLGSVSSPNGTELQVRRTSNPAL